MDEETYSMTIHFKESKELFAFIKEFQAWMKKRVHKSKKPDDNRGQRTGLLHAHARDIRLQNPNQTYRDCLRLAGERLKNQSSSTVGDGNQPSPEVC